MESKPSEKPLLDFLVEVGSDPEKMQASLQRREEVVESSDLSYEHKEMLRRGDLHEIRAALMSEAGLERDAAWVLGPAWVWIIGA